MPVSPLLDTDGVLNVKVLCEGNELQERAQLIRVSVQAAINRVPSATLVFEDGDMPEQTMPLSDAEDFKPGAQITVQAGYGSTAETVFEGVVVRHGVKIGDGNRSQLIVECRDKALKMTVARRSQVFVDKTDSDAMTALIGEHGLEADVTATALTHKALVQHYCSDWDFLLTRAEANGLVVIADAGQVTVAPPAETPTAVLKVSWGVDLIEMEADIDARHQLASVQAKAWDPSQRALVEAEAADPATVAAQGNLDGETLAAVLGLSEYTLVSGAALVADELTGWAKAQQLKSALARLQGRAKFQGSALAKVGAVVELAGVGARFSGTVWVSGLEHRMEQGQWSTDIRFGAPVDWFAERSDIVAPAAAGRVPGIEGLHAGVVKKIHEDPDGQHRVQIDVPTAGLTAVWARLLQFHASNGFGAFFVPEVDDEVLVGWFANDPSHPVILGSLYSSGHAPPYTAEATNKIKALVTRCKATIEIDDADKVITIKTPAANQVVFSDKDKSITVTDQHGNKIEMAAGGITLDSPKDIAITAKGKITLDAVGEVSISSKADVKVAGMNIACSAQVGMTAKGNASAELSASGQTTVKGAMVMIN